MLGLYALMTMAATTSATGGDEAALLAIKAELSDGGS
jgi:hypothetical protein